MFVASASAPFFILPRVCIILLAAVEIPQNKTMPLLPSSCSLWVLVSPALPVLHNFGCEDRLQIVADRRDKTITMGLNCGLPHEALWLSGVVSRDLMFCAMACPDSLLRKRRVVLILWLRAILNWVQHQCVAAKKNNNKQDYTGRQGDSLQKGLWVVLARSVIGQYLTKGGKPSRLSTSHL